MEYLHKKKKHDEISQSVLNGQVAPFYGLKARFFEKTV